MLSKVYSHNEDIEWHEKPASAADGAVEILNLAGHSKIETFLAWKNMFLNVFVTIITNSAHSFSEGACNSSC